MRDHEPVLEMFRRACGLNAPLQLECEDAGRPNEDRVVSVFDCPFVLIGRGSRSDLLLDHGDVSRRHVFLQAVAGGVYVVDLQSRSKVHWEGEEAPRSHGWFDQDRFINVGPYRIRRRDGQDLSGPAGHTSGQDSALQPEAANSDALPKAGLELPIRVGQHLSRWFLESSLTLVGRSEECQLVLTDDSISKFHAALVRTRLGVWVVDLLTREGTHVNGKRVRWAWLADGDTLRLGLFPFVVRYETALEQINRRDVPLAAGADSVPRPGTELAIRGGNSGQKPTVLAVRSGGSRSQAVSRAMNPPQSVMPSAFLASSGGTWEPAMVPAPVPAALWQHQMRMMELFHNDMMMMFQMLVAMRGEHLASVRHELGRVEQLSRELSELQHKLAQPSSSVNAGETGEAQASLPKRGSGASPTRKKGDGKPASRDPKHTGDRAARASHKSASDSLAGNNQARSASGPSPVQPDRAGPADDGQIHELLTKRIAELQRERQGYWQRILSVLNN
jgi:pSer/pThr/pTyr-binding forkhead associated (FHA) protein